MKCHALNHGDAMILLKRKEKKSSRGKPIKINAQEDERWIPEAIQSRPEEGAEQTDVRQSQGPEEKHHQHR